MTAPVENLAESLVDEQAILRGLLARDERAFDDFERRYAPQLFVIAKRMLRDEHEAQDATQEAFAGAYRTLPTFDGRSKLGTWLTRIVINKCLMKLRTRRRRPTVSIDALLPTFLDDGHASKRNGSWRSSSETDSDRELRQLLQEKMAELPDNYRVVIVLRDVQGLSTEDVAHALDETPNAVKVRLHRARQALKALLDPFMQPEDKQ